MPVRTAGRGGQGGQSQAACRGLVQWQLIWEGLQGTGVGWRCFCLSSPVTETRAGRVDAVCDLLEKESARINRAFNS